MNRCGLIVIVVATAVFLGCVVSPPSLMDDVDAVQAQIARNMLESGDWVTAQLNGIRYLEKAPLVYWLMAASYFLFGVSDVAARAPVVIGTVGLCWLTYRFGRWGDTPGAGLTAGTVLATSMGLWLFTRILIPDVLLTLTTTAALFALMRALDAGERNPNLWSTAFGASLGLGFLLKGLIGIVFPAGIAMLYLAVSRQIRSPDIWRRVHPGRTALIAMAIIAPWLALVIWRNPPYFDLTWRSEPGQWHGFFWFFFLNEHVFRYLNLRYPRDYDTVSRPLFLAGHLLWLFPWSVYLPAVLRQNLAFCARAGQLRLLALCWIAFVLVFFSFSTTQEYYSMPAYPAFALLIGSSLAAGASRPTSSLLWGTRIAAVLFLTAGTACLGLAAWNWNKPVIGDISAAMQYHYTTLSLGRALDLTSNAFAFLRVPLALAGFSFTAGALAIWRFQRHLLAVIGCMALAMVLFFQAARLALVVLDPYLSSRSLAAAVARNCHGSLIVDDQYYTFSSLFFYADIHQALLLNGRTTNLEYGSFAPGAPDVFLSDADLVTRWNGPDPYCLIAKDSARDRLTTLLGAGRLHELASSGGKHLFATADPNGTNKATNQFK